jgi:hypothetical protein
MTSLNGMSFPDGFFAEKFNNIHAKNVQNSLKYRKLNFQRHNLDLRHEW